MLHESAPHTIYENVSGQACMSGEYLSVAVLICNEKRGVVKHCFPPLLLLLLLFWRDASQSHSPPLPPACLPHTCVLKSEA